MFTLSCIICWQNSKYNSKGNYERDRLQRDSPNGNSYRSESPECESPRDRGSSYHSKTLYASKTREKERDNRDYKSREKYSGMKLVLNIFMKNKFYYTSSFIVSCYNKHIEF